MSDPASSPVEGAGGSVAGPGAGRGWRRDALVLGALILVTSLLFAFSRFDLTLAATFYHPGLDDPWPDQQWWLWNALNHYGPWPGGLLALAGVGVLLAGAVKPHWQKWRPHALAVVLTVVVGPGLLVNVVCKDHWGRPRPRDVVELGGTHAFRPPVIPDFGEAGKAFPCGHSSMGFVFFILFLIFRKKNPRLAWGMLGATVVWGLLIGVARMSAGAHFATDVLWSAWIPIFGAYVVYYGILRVPAWEERIAAGGSGTARFNPWLALAAGTVGAGLLVSLLAATPVVNRLQATQAMPTPVGGEGYAVNIHGGPLELTIDCDERGTGPVELDGMVRGFGFPGAGTAIGMDYRRIGHAASAGVLTVLFQRHGWFTEVVAHAHLRLPRNGLAYLRVPTAHGASDLLLPAPGGSLVIVLDDQGQADPRPDQVTLTEAWKAIQSAPSQ